MRRPSWTVPKPVPVRSADWAVAVAPPESERATAGGTVVGGAAGAGGAPSVAPPPSVKRLSLVPAVPHLPAGPSIEEQLRDSIAVLEARIAQMQAEHEAERSALLAARERLLAEARGAIVALSIGIAERAVGAELAASPALVEQWAEEAVAVLGGGVRNGNEVSFEGRVVEVTPAARVAAVASALDREAA